MKKWYKSRTNWKALVQLTIGLLSLVAGVIEDPQFTIPGVFFVVNATSDLWLRFRTNTAITI